MTFKESILTSIEDKRNKWIEASHAIHERPEIGNEEYYASTLLVQILEEEGFKVEVNIAGHPTGFIATKGGTKQGPTIGYLAEYDALPDLGHACGHNMIGVTSIAAAVGLGEIIEEIGGTLKVFGTPAEEGGVGGSAKASFVNAGVFEGTDVAMMVHPFSYTQRTSKAIAVAPMDFEFFGKAAHASASPEEGINALDAMLLFYNGISALRQQLTPDVRIHGIILDGGKAANIIPDYTKARFYLRAKDKKGIDALTKKVIHIAEGAGLMTGARVEYRFIQNIIEDLEPSPMLDEIFVSKMKELGQWVEPHIIKSFGSTDAGNVSHIIPTIHPTICITEEEVPTHTDGFREATCSKKADEAIIIGAKALALTGLEVLEKPKLLQTIQEEWKNIQQKVNS